MPRDQITSDVTSFIHDLSWGDLSDHAREMAELCVLDLIGVAVGGTGTRLSAIVRDHGVQMFGGSDSFLMFDGRNVSPAGVALAGGMTIDALDAHDGYNPAKGHVGCSVFPAALAMAVALGRTGGQDFLTDIALGYELGSRLALALHGTVSDYHTSGAWGAVACAAVGARQMGLDAEATRHALGIAEYHGPRSQMMRCIDHPTMLKDGSGFGAMAGVSAAFLAKSGFSGAPAITIEGEEAAQYWSTLGSDWLITQQYFKPYPVCRWAQAPIEAVLGLKHQHKLSSEMVERIEIRSFHESIRLATNDPKTTEEAQYSTSFPCAVALVRDHVGPEDVTEKAFADPEIQRLSKSLRMVEDDYCNANFPAERFAAATLYLKDGRKLQSDIASPRWTADHPPTAAELRAKFHSYSDATLGQDRADKIEKTLIAFQDGGTLGDLVDLLRPPLVS